MKAATVSTILGLTLISGALLAETAGLNSAPASAEEAFGAHDANGDGRISLAEAERSNVGLHTHFSKFDRDADGALSLEEFRRHAEPESAGG